MTASARPTVNLAAKETTTTSVRLATQDHPAMVMTPTHLEATPTVPQRPQEDLTPTDHQAILEVITTARLAARAATTATGLLETPEVELVLLGTLTAMDPPIDRAVDKVGTIATELPAVTTTDRLQTLEALEEATAITNLELHRLVTGKTMILRTRKATLLLAS